MNNLVVSFELLLPERNREALLTVMRGMGTCTRVRFSLWHVKSKLNAEEVTKRLRHVLEPHDNLLVIDATHGNAAWFNLDPETSDVLRRQWNGK